MTTDDDDLTSSSPRRPSSGYALTVTLPPAFAGNAASIDELFAAFACCGAELRGDAMVGEQRRIELACSGVAQQRAVRDALASFGVPADVYDTTFALHVGGKLEV